MNQRQLNMLQAIEDGVTQARDELKGPGSAKAIAAALADIVDDTPRSMGLAATAYYAAMLMAWKARGCPDLLT